MEGGEMTQTLISLYEASIGLSIEKLSKELLSIAREVTVNAEIRYRVKDVQVLAKKMVLKEVESVLKIHDVYGFRILVPSVGESCAVLELVTKTLPSFLDHDYIAKPKTRVDKPHLLGKSLRLIQVVAFRNGIPFEVQITTFEFNESNEALHAEYHREKYG